MPDNKVTNNIRTSLEGRDLVMEGIFDGPRDLVFKAFSNSERFASWWGPSGWQTENREFNFKPDGVWHYCMRCKDEKQGEFYGQESWGKAVYQEIIVPEKNVYTDMFAGEEGNSAGGMPVTLVTMTFVENEGDKTYHEFSIRFSRGTSAIDGIGCGPRMCLTILPPRRPS